MMHLATIVSLFIPFLLGWTLVRNTFRNMHLPVYFLLAASYGLGTAIVSQGMFFMGVIGVQYEIKTIALAASVAIIIALSSLFRNSWRSSGISQNKWLFNKFILDPGRLFYLLLGVYVIFQVFCVFWNAWNLPMAQFDALSTNVFRAKIIYFAQSLKCLPRLPHPTYPLHTELLQVWISVLSGKWEELLVMLIFPFYYVSFLGVSYYFLKEFTNKRWALLGVFALTTSNFFNYHAAIAYRDFPMLFYNCATLMFLILWDKGHKDEWLWMAGFFAGITTTVKSEGVGYSLIHLVLLGVLFYPWRGLHLGEKIYKLAKFIQPYLAICLFNYGYLYFAVIRHIPSDNQITYDFNLSRLTLNFSPETLSRLAVVIREILENLFFTGNWNILWAILAITLLTYRNYSRPVMLFLMCLTLYLLLYICGYAFTQQYIWIAETNFAISRQLLHIFPICVFLIILLNFSNSDKKTMRL